MTKKRRPKSQRAHRGEAPTRGHDVPEKTVRRLRVVQPGQPRLEWQSPVFASDWQNGLALAAANTALEILRAERTPAQLAALGRKLMGSVSTLADGLIAQGQAGPIACQAGCSACCHQVVGATPLELFVLVAHLQTQLKGLDSLRERVHTAAARAQGKTPRERYSHEHPCVLLEEGRCFAYEVRPLACRGVNALRRTVCEELIVEGPRKEAFFEKGEGSPGYMEPGHAVHAISAGLQLSLSELYALDMHPLDLTKALDFVLNVEPQAFERWLNGEPVFAPVRGGYDSRDPERLRAIGVNVQR